MKSSKVKAFVAVLCALFLGASVAQAQIYQPVKWSFSLVMEEGSAGTVNLTAAISAGWSVYSQQVDPKSGIQPTEVHFERGPHFELLGKSVESDLGRKEGYDPIFNTEVVKYVNQMKITQRVRIVDPSVPIKGSVTFMTCDDTRCLPPEQVDFSLALKASPSEVPAPTDASEVVADATLYGMTHIQASSSEGCNKGSGFEESDQSLLTIFLLGLLGGFLALLTPCVFPLIPLTVSFFTKGSEDRKKGFRKAMLYGGFIFLVYLLLSLPFHLLDSLNPDILNDISTNVWLNLAFFAIFLFFAFSFFGYYEITLPSRFTNKVSSAEGVGGALGVFFMALTLCLVSFSCTGPILGSLLAGALSSNGGAMQLSAGMGGFGLALALPFSLFAMFPGWLNKLPKSGGWLNSVKVVLGFLEVALALKFLSNADLVMHWGLISYELFIGLWIVICLALALYLLGVYRFPHDSPKQKLAPWRVVMALVALGFGAYLSLGLGYKEATRTFTSLKLLSGLAPPVGYSWVHPNACPNDLNCFKDLEAGIAYAQEHNKPILLDFTGYACVNCRKMEEHVWSQEKVLSIINQEYVLVSLYVDDKTLLSRKEQVQVERVQGGTRRLKNYGHKWSHYQTKYFGTNSQPYYVALTPDAKKMLSHPVGYTPDAREYKDFLECGLRNYNATATAQ